METQIENTTLGNRLFRHVAGMAIVSGITSALFSGFAICKGFSVAKYGKIGAVIGGLSSLGFGNDVYSAVAHKNDKTSILDNPSDGSQQNYWTDRIRKEREMGTKVRSM